jgi:O-antigen/teichoic acid export membrane protein
VILRSSIYGRRRASSEFTAEWMTNSSVNARHFGGPHLRASLRRRFATGAWWSLVGAGSARGITLLAGLIAGRMLGPSGFGEFGLIQSTHAVFGAFAGLGLGTATAKLIAENRDSAPARAGGVIAIASMMSLGAGLIMALLLFGLSPWLAAHTLAAPHLTPDLRVATGLLLFGAVNGAQSGSLAGLEAFRTIATLSALRASVGAAGMLVGLHYHGVSGGVLGLVLGEFASALLSQFLVHRECAQHGVRLHWKTWRLDIRRLWALGLPALLGSIATMPALWAAKVWLVNQPNGYSQAGIFDAANRWALVILFLPSAIAPVQLPMLASMWSAGDNSGYRRLVQVNAAVAAAICIVPGIVLASLSAQVMAIYGPAFHPGRVTLAILSLSAVAVAMNTVLGNALIGAGRIWHRCLFDYLLASILAGLAWWLIPLQGAAGLAVASAAAYGLTSVIMWTHLWRLSRHLTGKAGESA